MEKKLEFLCIKEELYKREKNIIFIDGIAYKKCHTWVTLGPEKKKVRSKTIIRHLKGKNYAENNYIISSLYSKS